MNGSSRTPADGAPRRGGARGGGGGAKVYRPVSAPKAEGDAAPSGRKVVVLDAEEPAPRAFKSSLQAAVRGERPAPVKDTAKRDDHRARAQQQPQLQHERKAAARSEKPKSPRSVPPRDRSGSPQKRGGEQRHHAAAPSGRVVTSLSTAAATASPKKLSDRKKPVLRDPSSGDSPPRRFVSSLSGEVVTKNAAGARLSDDKAERAGGRSVGAARGGSGDARQPSNPRVVEDASAKLSEKNLAAHASAMHGGRPRRKNSAESLSSMRSGYSARSEWSERSDYSRASSRRGGGDRDREARYAGASRYDDTRHSFGNGGRGARFGAGAADSFPARHLSRSASETMRTSVETPPAPAQHVVATARSSQDVRFQKAASQDQRERPPSDTVGPTGAAGGATTGAAPMSLREAIQMRSGGRDPRAAEFTRSRSSSLARSVASDVDTTSRNSLHKNPEPTARPAAPTKPAFTSSLARSVTEAEKKEPVGQKPADATADEAERRRLANASLREKMEARNAARASASAASDGKKEFRSGILPAGAGASEPPTLTSKTQRSNEHFEKLKQEDAQREAARRSANAFKSSLAASISANQSAPSSRAAKTCYTPSELRRLMPAATSKPRDLPDMKIVEVVEFRPPPARPIGGAGPLRTGRVVGRERERDIGRLARKPERSTGRAQVVVQRQSSSYGGGRADAGRPRRGGGGERGGGGGGGRGGRNYAPPPPPLYDGPIEPLTKSENRWVAKKQDLSPAASALSQVKSLLNKLTREKFAKITTDLCAIELTDFALLRNVVTAIMDKAVEEPSFADVYADLCKELSSRTANKRWGFIRAVESVAPPATFHWAAVREEDYQSMLGPFKSLSECFDDALKEQSAATPTSSHVALASMKFFHQADQVVAVTELSPGTFFYHKRQISELTDDEPVAGSFPSADTAIAAAHVYTSFKSLLVMRCQVEFEKTNKRSSAGKEKAPEGATETEMDPRQKEIMAIRAKRRMLGNIRFIGELFKVDMLKQTVLQHCIFHLLGLEMIRGSAGGAQEFAAKTVRFPDEEDMEALCKMLATAGKKFDQPKTKTVMNVIILRLVELSEDAKLPSRARFLIKDLLEMRDHMWEPRRAELQQKTLEEVRREAHKLQQQGKNAQHDNLSHRRRKTQITSAQLAKQSSSLLLHEEQVVEDDEDEGDEAAAEPVAAPSSPTKPDDSAAGSSASAAPNDAAKFATRIKSIIQEYTSIVDIEEAAACVRELPSGPCHAEFAEQTINLSLEGKAAERELAVNLLVGLYERGALTAMEIEAALMAVAEFLEDLRIDIPLVHQSAALLLGRLIAAGCFGISWMLAHPLAHVVECGLAAAVFVDVLAVLELDSDLRSVRRMLVDEEIAVAKVLPAAAGAHGRSNDTPEVHQFLVANGIEDFFGADTGNDRGVADDDDDCDDELDPEVAAKMRAALEEYLSVKDLPELVACVDELGDEAVARDRWMHFAHVAAVFALDHTRAVREDVAALLVVLWESERATADDVEVALEAVLAQYEELRIDVPTLGANLGALWSPLFRKLALTLGWLRAATRHLAPAGLAAEVVSALLSDFAARFGDAELREWWAKQLDARDGLWNELLDGPGTVVPHAELVKWKQILEL